MANDTVLIALVTGGFAVLGATLPQITSVVQSARRDKRKQSERFETARRDACVALLKAAGELRTQVANNHDYHGDEMTARLALVREHATAAQVAAASVALLVAQPLAELAMELAAAAGELAMEAAETTSLEQRASIRLPDFAKLDRCIAAFTASAVSAQGVAGR
jgi:hypothetical protein